MTDFRYKTTGIASCFSSDHTQILTSSYDNTARIWDRTGKEILRLVHPLSVKSAEFSLAKNISSLHAMMVLQGSGAGTAKSLKSSGGIMIS